VFWRSDCESEDSGFESLAGLHITWGLPVVVASERRMAPNC
jgi:hypothetical protein